MFEKESPPTGGETARGTGTNEARYQFQRDYKHFSADCQAFPVAEVLRHGNENATTARELSALLGWPSRMVTRQIERERRMGAPILAGKDGYFLPANDAERDRYLNSLARREREIGKTRAAVAATKQQIMRFGGGVEA